LVNSPENFERLFHQFPPLQLQTLGVLGNIGLPYPDTVQYIIDLAKISNLNLVRSSSHVAILAQMWC